MKRTKESKKFKKTSIEFIKNMYRKGVNYVFDKNSWKSNSPETLGAFRVLLHTRKSLKRLGNEMNIFKAPTMVGLKIIYYKSVSYLFDNNCQEFSRVALSEDKYLLRDLSDSQKISDQTDKELKIFKFPNIDYLEKLYFKSKEKVVNLGTVIED